MAENNQLPPADAPEQGRVSVGDLIRMCQQAANSRRKSIPKHHRLLLMNCAYALQQLVQRLDAHEQAARKVM